MESSVHTVWFDHPQGEEYYFSLSLVGISLAVLPSSVVLQLRASETLVSV